MGFIKHALIGIALYETVKYVLKQQDPANDPANDPQVSFYQPQMEPEIDLVEEDPWKNSLANDELRAPDS